MYTVDQWLTNDQGICELSAMDVTVSYLIRTKVGVDLLFSGWIARKVISTHKTNVVKHSLH